MLSPYAIVHQAHFRLDFYFIHIKYITFLSTILYPHPASLSSLVRKIKGKSESLWEMLQLILIFSFGQYSIRVVFLEIRVSYWHVCFRKFEIKGEILKKSSNFKISECSLLSKGFYYNQTIQNLNFCLWYDSSQWPCDWLRVDFCYYYNCCYYCCCYLDWVCLVNDS